MLKPLILYIHVKFCLDKYLNLELCLIVLLPWADSGYLFSVNFTEEILEQITFSPYNSQI